MTPSVAASGDTNLSDATAQSLVLGRKKYGRLYLLVVIECRCTIYT